MRDVSEIGTAEILEELKRQTLEDAFTLMQLSGMDPRRVQQTAESHYGLEGYYARIRWSPEVGARS